MRRPHSLSPWRPRKKPPYQQGGWHGGRGQTGNIDRELGEITAKRFRRLPSRSCANPLHLLKINDLVNPWRGELCTAQLTRCRPAVQGPVRCTALVRCTADAAADNPHPPCMTLWTSYRLPIADIKRRWKQGSLCVVHTTRQETFCRDIRTKHAW